jgi:RNA polymerase sigma-B factor
LGAERGVTTLTVDLELTRLLEAYRAGDDSARERLVERYMPLVRSLATRYAGRGEPLEDLVQVGSIGLLLAIERFDVERGVQFSTFAVPTIVGEIQRHFRDRAWAIHVPRRLKELALRLNRVVESSTATLGRSPTIAELAEAMDVGEDEVVEALETHNAYTTRSLSQPLGPDGQEETMQDVLGSVEGGYDAVEDGTLVEAGLSALDARERAIVELRFYDGLTQSEIAARVGISQMHVSRLLRKALMTMRGRLEEERSTGGTEDP